MTDAPRHLAPGSLLLCLQQLRKVFEHKDISQTLSIMLESSHGNSDVQGGALDEHFHLSGRSAHAIGTAQERFEIFENLGSKDISQRRADQHRRRARLQARRMEQAKQGMVYMGDASFRIQ